MRHLPFYGHAVQMLSDWDDTLGTYQQGHGAPFNSESGELPTGSRNDQGSTSCVIRLRFAFFPHTVVCIRSLADLQELAFAFVELATAEWDKINTKQEQLQQQIGQSASLSASRKQGDERRLKILQDKRANFLTERWDTNFFMAESEMLHVLG